MDARSRGKRENAIRGVIERKTEPSERERETKKEKEKGEKEGERGGERERKVGSEVNLSVDGSMGFERR